MSTSLWQVNPVHCAPMQDAAFWLHRHCQMEGGYMTLQRWVMRQHKSQDMVEKDGVTGPQEAALILLIHWSVQHHVLSNPLLDSCVSWFIPLAHSPGKYMERWLHLQERLAIKKHQQKQGAAGSPFWWHSWVCVRGCYKSTSAQPAMYDLHWLMGFLFFSCFVYCFVCFLSSDPYILFYLGFLVSGNAFFFFHLSASPLPSHSLSPLSPPWAVAASITLRCMKCWLSCPHH